MPSLSRILGTAGHIDHGKTALVRALTGTDTDRLPEERARGITIDLGFAHLDLGDVSLGIVDVPGHERFVRNMLAGATGVDVALLVVAADDSVMPQTREHLAILQLLGVERGVIAITKADRVEPEWIELVEADVRELVAGTFLADAPIVVTSATTGAGIDALRDALAAEARAAVGRGDDVPFRLAVDRTFVQQGVGTVVTGTVASGSVAVGETLDWLPVGDPVVVRGLESHGTSTERALRGQRAAIHLGGVHHERIGRGHELAAPGWLKASGLVTAELRVLPESPWPVRHRATVRLHLGAQEIMVTVLLLQGTRIEPGETSWVQFSTETSAIVARSGQPFVVRAESPVLTIGGGHIVEPVARRIARRDRTARERLSKRRDVSSAARIEAALAGHGFDQASDLALCRDADVIPGELTDLLAALRRAGKMVQLELGHARTGRFATSTLAEAGDRIERELTRRHAAAPLEELIPIQQLIPVLRDLDERTFGALLGYLRRVGRLRGTDVGVALVSFAPALDTQQVAMRDAVLAAFDAAAYRPPDVAALADAEDWTVKAVKPIVELLVQRGDLVHLGGGCFLHGRWNEALEPKLRAEYGTDGFTMSELRSLLDTSRKYALPIGEYLDRSGVTRRIGDQRMLRKEQQS